MKMGLPPLIVIYKLIDNLIIGNHYKKLLIYYV
jgi:hypothetical protein